MVGSPNYIFMTQDADQSSFEAPVAVPDGSVAIEDLFESFYTLKDEPYDDAAFDGRSDYQAFHLSNDIPAGGLFTGAEVPQDRRAKGDLGRDRGRTVRPVLPPGLRHVRQQQRPRARRQCRHVAFSLLTYAYSTEAVNGVPGKKVPGKFTIPDPAGSEGTCPVQPPTCL